MSFAAYVLGARRTSKSKTVFVANRRGHLLDLKLSWKNLPKRMRFNHRLVGSGLSTFKSFPDADDSSSISSDSDDGKEQEKVLTRLLQKIKDSGETSCCNSCKVKKAMVASDRV